MKILRLNIYYIYTQSEISVTFIYIANSNNLEFYFINWDYMYNNWLDIFKAFDIHSAKNLYVYFFFWYVECAMKIGRNM